MCAFRDEDAARALFLCLTIVAAFPLNALAADPGAEDAPVSARDRGGRRDWSSWIRPAIARGSCPSSPACSTRNLLHELRPSRSCATVSPPLRSRRPVSPRVPVPLTAASWSRAIFRRPIDADQLVAAIIGDRRASLMCHTLAALDDETLEFLSQHLDVLTRLYEGSAASFAAFGASLHIRDGRVVPPGGDTAIPLWEGALGERVDTPDRFVTALFGLHGGRLAYLYDTIAQLEAPNAAFALGLWIADPAVRLTRFVALAEVCAGSYREWHIETMPFSKPLHDLATLLMRMHVEPSGTPVRPGGPIVLVGGVRERRSAARAPSRSSRTRGRSTPRGWRT